MGLLEWGSEKDDMGPIEIVVATTKGVAKFASKHAVLTAATAVTAGVGGYVAYDNYKGADGANGGGVVKQDVAVKDAKGDLQMEVQGVKTEAPKANEPAKSDAKSGNDEILKKLQETAKDADIKAEAAKATEQTPAQPELPPEKPYIPEQAKAEAAYNDTSANLLDGNGSAAFKTASFGSSGSGSGSNAVKAAAQSGNKGAT